MVWSENVKKGLYSGANKANENNTFYVENMDTKRHNSTTYYENLANFYKIKYQDIKFDIIYSSDNNAFEFLKKYRNILFGNVPVVFGGVNDFDESMLNNTTNFTGVVGKLALKKNMELILKLHPKVKNIFVINDYLLTGRKTQNQLEKEFEKYTSKVNIIYNKNQTMEELQTEISNLGNDTVVLMGLYFSDNLKKNIPYEKVGEYLLRFVKVPTYCLTSFNITNNVIGGYVSNGYSQGNSMANIGKRILNGVSPLEIGVVEDEINRYIFNVKALNNNDINKSDLPFNSEFINTKYSFYEQFNDLINANIFIILFVIFIYIIFRYNQNIFTERWIVKILVYGPIVFLPLIIGTLIYNLVQSNHQLFLKEIERNKVEYLQNQKSIVYEEIDKIERYMRSIEEKSKDITKNDLKKEIVYYISNVRYGRNGYVFAMTSKGVVIAHGDSKEFVGQESYNNKDEKGVFYVHDIIKQALGGSQKFSKFRWYNKNMNQMDTRHVYARYFAEYDLIVGAGFFVNDLNDLIEKETKKLNKRNDEQIKQIISISTLVLLVVLVLSYMLSMMIKRIFENYNNKLHALNNSLTKRVEEEIKISKEKDMLIHHQAKMVSMGEMLGNIAHQWRQPLSIISVGATGLKMQKEYDILSDEKFMQTCDAINENAQYLSKTIDDFKNFIKNDRDKVKFNLKENIESFLSLVDSSISKHQITLVLDLDDTIVLNSYPNELKQCFMNLFSNAKDALDNNKGERYLFVSTSIDGYEVSISFKDNAGGIDEDLIEKIFEPYFTTKHKSRGTGLGLSMTYKIVVEGLDGSINVSNKKYSYYGENFVGAEFLMKLSL